LFFVYPCTDFESGLLIENVSNELLTPLHSLIKRPRFLDGDASPRDDDFHPLLPSLQLFLSGNFLSVLPSELFNLQNITVLSLRNNRLEALSPHISKLHNLVELNISQNRLRFLPWEFLNLIRGGKLQSLTVFPNPLAKPFEYFEFLKDETPIARQWALPHSSANLNALIIRLKERAVKLTETFDQGDIHPELDASLESEYVDWMLELSKGYSQAFSASMMDLAATNTFVPTDATPKLEDFWAQLLESRDPALDTYLYPIFIASTRITRFGGDGLLPTGLRQDPPPSQLPPHKEILSAVPGGALIKGYGSRVPSLFALAAMSASTVPELPVLHTLLPDDAPKPVVQALETACQAREEGGKICSVCGRNYIIPRTEWVEYWHLPPRYGQRSSPEEMFWPFLRKGCSPGCLPEFPKR
jgi:hypothetical protein